jgi:hypothetical protein
MQVLKGHKAERQRRHGDWLAACQSDFHCSGNYP